MKNILTITVLLLLATLIFFGGGVLDTFADPDDPGNGDNPPSKFPNPRVPNFFFQAMFWVFWWF